VVAVAAIGVLLSAAAPAVSSYPGAADFDVLVEEVAGTILARFPEDVTELGLSTRLGLHDDRLNDLSRSYRLETARLARDALDRLSAIDPAALTPDQRITLAVSRWFLDDLVTTTDDMDHEYAVGFITGAHANLPEFLADIHPISDIAQAEAYVARLRGAATQLRQVADQLARSESLGILPTRTALGIAAWQIEQQLRPPGDHPLVTDLEARLASFQVPDVERDRILADARAAVESDLLPAYRDLLEAVQAADTRPDTRPGVLEHPDGTEYYAAALRHHTTTSLTPEDVHRIGAAEVERLRGELSAALGPAGFDVEHLGFAGAIEAARAAAGSVPLESEADRDALLRATQAFVSQADAEVGGLFTTTPSAPIEVRRPRPGREAGSGAWYRPPPISGERPGIYYLSLAGDAFEMQTFATTNYHEAVPGHHFQIALQRENEDLPLIQRATTFTGYAEGWALYAERLAAEAGLYADDPLGDIGRLRMELLRAARAVADTGIHALGWSRDKAIAYLVDLGFPAPQAASEVDRYIVWPGQAPAYLIGMLEILRLRGEAQRALGPDFDLAGFHEAILGHGSVPLEVLDDIVAEYIDSGA
jgi:uncharacterized protein (DUF885 family)